MEKIVSIGLVICFSFAFFVNIVHPQKPPPPIDQYVGWYLFQVFFEPHDNTTALTDYARQTRPNPQTGRPDIIVMLIDYIRGAAEVAVSPERYMEVRLEFESGDLDNFNIVTVDLNEYVKENYKVEAP